MNSSLTSFEDYSAFGFDVDHCLSRYKVNNLTKLLHKSITEKLIKFYEYTYDVFDLTQDEDFINFSMNYLTIDINHGTVIKLGENKTILKAYRGKKLLTSEQIVKMYGSEKKLKDYQEFKHGRVYPIFNCPTFFEHIFPLIFAQIIEAKKLNVECCKFKSNKEIFNNINDAFQRVYVYWNYNNTYHEMAEFSSFYKTLLADPGNYMYQQDELVNILKHLKKKGKFLFIVTNSPYEFANFTLSFGLGKDWMDLFDLIIFKANKPHFFISREIELKKQESFLSDKCFMEGNIHTVDKIIRSKANNPDGKVVFFGDNFLSDNYFSNQFPLWQSVNLLEELNETSNGFIEGGLNYGLYWGNFLTEKVNDEIQKTFWHDFFKKNCADCFPLLCCESLIKFVNY